MKVQLGFLSLAFALSACSAKVSGGSDAAFPTASNKPFVDEVSGGPDLDGEYKSSCVDTNFAGQYPKQKLDVKISGRDIVRTDQQYSDTQCQVPGPQTTRTGKFRYVLNKGADTFEVEYQFDLPNGGNYRVGENIRLSDSILYTSNMVSGDALPETALYKQSQSSGSQR